MKRYILLITIFALVFVMGCTQLPLSEETGVGPGEYEGKASTEEIKIENNNLKEELEKTNGQLDKTIEELEVLEKEYLSLAKSNENTESKLQIVDSEDLPKFNTESTDKDSIISYLKDSSKLIDDSIKGIEVISTDTKVVFRTLGYGKEYNQIFIWDEGENNPVLIDGAVFDKEGSYEWLGEYLLIKNSGKNKVLDIENKKIRGIFDDPQKSLLLEGTTTLLLKDNDNKFVLYDFVNNSNKEINLDNNKYNDFNLQDDAIVFSGTYIEENVEYEMRASINLDKFMEVYQVKSSDTIDLLEGSEEAEDAGEDTGNDL